RCGVETSCQCFRVAALGLLRGVCFLWGFIFSNEAHAVALHFCRSGRCVQSNFPASSGSQLMDRGGLVCDRHSRLCSFYLLERCKILSVNVGSCTRNKSGSE